ncbi:MAG: hypothetical protein AAGD00_07055, partial [Planctomycetota bacterium]
MRGTLAAVIAAGACASVAHAGTFALVGVNFDTGTLWNINTATAGTSSPRATGFAGYTGIAADGAGLLYATTTFGAPIPNALVTIDALTGDTNVVGSLGLNANFEGDLAFDPGTGSLYGLQDAQSLTPELYRIDPNTGSAFLIGPVATAATGDLSAMAFVNDDLLAIDTQNDQLLTLNRFTGAVLGAIALSEPIGSLAGMRVDRATGDVSVADGEQGGADAGNLY